MNEHDSQGRPTGLWEERFSGGGLSGTGRYQDGEKTGEWTYWHKNNQLKAHGTYAHGKLDGSWVWYRAGGGLLQAGAFVQGLQDGLWARYHASGELLDRGVYALGKKTGEWVAFDPTGAERRDHPAHARYCALAEPVDQPVAEDPPHELHPLQRDQAEPRQRRSGAEAARQVQRAPGRTGVLDHGAAAREGTKSEQDRGFPAGTGPHVRALQ